MRIYWKKAGLSAIKRKSMDSSQTHRLPQQLKKKKSHLVCMCVCVSANVLKTEKQFQLHDCTAAKERILILLYTNRTLFAKISQVQKVSWGGNYLL